jgi:SnoaL-like domain
MSFLYLSPADDLQIRNLIARYALYTDGGEPEKFANLFLDAGSWTRENSPPKHLGGSGLPRETLVGREQLIGLIKTVVSRFSGKIRHQMTDLMLEPGSDETRANIVFRALVTDWTAGPGKVAMTVHYTGECVKTADGWKFAWVSARVLPE